MTPPSVVRLFTVGDCRIEVGQHSVLPNASHMFATLLYLGLERGRWIARTELSELLFPEDDAERASHSLRQLLYKLRRIGTPLESTAQTVRLRECDAIDDITVIVDGSPSTRREAALRDLSVFPSYTPPTPPFSRWLETRRERLHHLLVRAIAQELEPARK